MPVELLKKLRLLRRYAPRNDNTHITVSLRAIRRIARQSQTPRWDFFNSPSISLYYQSHWKMHPFICRARVQDCRSDSMIIVKPEIYIYGRGQMANSIKGSICISHSFEGPDRLPFAIIRGEGFPLSEISAQFFPDALHLRVVDQIVHFQRIALPVEQHTRMRLAPIPRGILCRRRTPRAQFVTFANDRHLRPVFRYGIRFPCEGSTGQNGHKGAAGQIVASRGTRNPAYFQQCRIQIRQFHKPITDGASCELTRPIR